MFGLIKYILAWNLCFSQDIDKPADDQNSTANKRMPAIMLDPVYLVSERSFKNETDRLKYLKLKRDVTIAYKYAKETANIINELNYKLINCTTKHERKALIKSYYQGLKKQTITISKQLTPTQGKIILKLIYRQTGYTTYQLLTDKTNKLNASVIQLLAKSLGQDLKSTYNPIDDYEIESIIQNLEKTE